MCYSEEENVSRHKRTKGVASSEDEDPRKLCSKKSRPNTSTKDDFPDPRPDYPVMSEVRKILGYEEGDPRWNNINVTICYSLRQH
jgi:hypothetical protein